MFKNNMHKYDNREGHWSHDRSLKYKGKEPTNYEDFSSDLDYVQQGSDQGSDDEIIWILRVIVKLLFKILAGMSIPVLLWYIL